MKAILVFVCLLYPIVVEAQTPDSTRRFSSAITVTAEALVYYDNTPNVNVYYVSRHRFGSFGPYLYVQAGESHSAMFIGMVRHWTRSTIGAGLGIGKIDDRGVTGLNLVGQYDNGFLAGQLKTELGTTRWLRSYAAITVKPRVHIGWFYQTDVGQGPRLQFDLREAPANIWICIDRSFDKEVMGFSYTF